MYPETLIVWKNIIGTYGTLRLFMNANDVYFKANFEEVILYLLVNKKSC